MTTSSSSEARGPILIVDDEEQALLSVGFTLSANGLPRSVGCRDGREAVDVLARQPCSAVLLDLLMPRMSGQEVLEWIRRNRPELPVIVITANGDERAREACLRAGAVDCLAKPVDEDTLVRAVRRALERGCTH
jgi:two-component system, NtrC family, response regulator AtoC